MWAFCALPPERLCGPTNSLPNGKVRCLKLTEAAPSDGYNNAESMAFLLFKHRDNAILSVTVVTRSSCPYRLYLLRIKTVSSFFLLHPWQVVERVFKIAKIGHSLRHICPFVRMEHLGSQ